MNRTFRYYILFLFVGSTSFLNAQTITGKISTTTNEPIPYATIQIGETYGTVTNEEGIFTLEIPKNTNEKEVLISCLGFETKTIPIAEFTAQEYILNEQVNQLSEVFLTNKKLSVQEILKKIQENSAKNYNPYTQQQLFYRSNFNNTPKKLDFKVVKANMLSKSAIAEINTAFNTLRKKAVNNTSSYYSDKLVNIAILKDTAKINIPKSTKLINEEKDLSYEKLAEKFIELTSKQLDTSVTYKVKSGFFTITDSLKVGEDLNPKADSLRETIHLKKNITELLKNYSVREDSRFAFLHEYSKNDYEIEDIFFFNDDLVYKIKFSPKRKSQKYEGVFYVNITDFAVVKIEYQLAEGRTGRRLNLKFLAGIKYVQSDIKVSIYYTKNNSNFYSMSYFKYEDKSYNYISRTVKLKKNRSSKADEKNIFKFDFMVENISKNRIDIYALKTEACTPEKFINFKNEETYRIEKIAKYNPSYWKAYNIIAPIEAIKNYNAQN